jgi:heat shock protein HslJ
MPFTSLMMLMMSMSMLASYAGFGRFQPGVDSWLDQSKPASWNKPGLSLPAAPKITGDVDPRCRNQARTPQLDEDRRLSAQGWDLVGGYQGGWDVLVIRATAGYDGMCRPRQYQDFVFMRGVFAGTLSPHAMDSRVDGALSRVFLQSKGELTAEYQRYAAGDPLCCPSRTTTVVFELAGDPPVLRPVSATTAGEKGTGPPTPTGTKPPDSSSPSPSAGVAGTSWQLVKFQGGDGTTLTPDDRAKYTIEFVPGGRLIARIDCNRGRGTWKSSGPGQIEFGPMALTRAQCPPGSLHDQIMKQWGNIRSFVIRDGHLFLALMADGGIYEFEPIAKR